MIKSLSTATEPVRAPLRLPATDDLRASTENVRIPNSRLTGEWMRIGVDENRRGTGLCEQESVLSRPAYLRARFRRRAPEPLLPAGQLS